ncbi:MAG TPA: ABC transporter ATP-binding protein [bacterium]|nr:ABC transporter ATP-binding protein [bacterium]
MSTQPTAVVDRPTPTAEPILVTGNLGIRFGGLQALRDFSIQLPPRSLCALIGPNGAGKTTVFNLLTGVYQPTEGSITFRGRPLAGLPPYRRTSLGICRTFQNIRLFRDLTVLDNVKIAHTPLMGYTAPEGVLRLPRFRRREREIEAESLRLLGLFELQEKAFRPAGSLPYGEQRRLEIARALATEPKLLLLDEPAAGMNPQESEELLALIRRVRDEFGCTILLIEHDMKVVAGLSEHVWVLDHGELICEGPYAKICKDPRVVAAYLGGG